MNPDIRRLYEIACLPERRIIGLMSGTSLDGLDIVLCSVKGSGRSVSVRVDAFKTYEYTDPVKTDIRKVFSKKDGRLDDVCMLNRTIAELHADLVLSAIENWNIDKESIHLIASHGQTIFHSPLLHPFNSTLQIGDGDHLAYKTGIITISDFRQKHVAAGGQGAPLAIYGDYLLTGEDESDVVWLNIGGIANITFISRVEKKLITSDTGPGNTLMDAWMRKYYQEKMDAGGRVASTGIADEMLLEQLSEHTWFTQPLPKTCGPEIFNIEYVETALNNSTCALSHKDIIATLNELTARSLADVINSLTANSFKLFISGGGTHNKNLIERIKIRLPLAVIQDAFPFEIHPDAKEAVLIALLANDMITGSPKLWEDAGIFPATGFGKISLPH